MIPKVFTSNKFRWIALAAVSLIIIVIHTVQRGFFHGGDWMLYLILVISAAFAWHYRYE